MATMIKKIYTIKNNRIRSVKSRCSRFGWIKVNENTFAKDGCVLNFYLQKDNSLSVLTEMVHPLSGHTKLLRRKVSMSLLNKILKYPREHTDKAVHIEVCKESSYEN